MTTSTDAGPPEGAGHDQPVAEPNIISELNHPTSADDASQGPSDDSDDSEDDDSEHDGSARSAPVRDPGARADDATRGPGAGSPEVAREKRAGAQARPGRTDAWEPPGAREAPLTGRSEHEGGPR